MTAKNCFKSKIKTGRVSQRAGNRILAIMRDAEQRAQAGDEAALRQAQAEALTIAKADAVKREAIAAGSIVAQTNVLRAQKVYTGKVGELRDTTGDLGFGNKAPPGLGGAQSPLGAAVNSLLVRDIHDISTWDNVFYGATSLRKESMARFADGVERLRPKKLGLVPESAREADVLDAAFGHEASPQGKATFESFAREAEVRRVEFNQAAGYEAIPKRADWRLPNPKMQAAKVLAFAPDAFAARVAGLLDRDKMIDFSTGRRMSDDKLAEVLRDVHETGRLDGAEGQPNAGFVGEGPLSARRSASRTLIFKDRESWQQFNELFGDGAGVFDTMMGHFSAMAHDTAIMRVLGPDPASTKRFILSLFDRETARIAKTGDPDNPASLVAAVKANRQAASSVAAGRNSFETFFAHMTGEASIPVNAQLAATMGDVRHGLAAAQLGGALLSSFSDLGTLAATARFNGLPVMATLTRAIDLLKTGDAEITATQAGVVSDSIAHGAGQADRYMGETIRAGLPAKMSSAVLRASGLRRWSSVLRSSFGLEFMARMANHVEKGTAFDALPFKTSLQRYGLGAAEWAEIARVSRENGMWTPRQSSGVGESFLRPLDVRAAGLTQAANALNRMLQTEIDFTAIEGDPVARAALFGRSQPGTLGGEARRAGFLYKSFPLTVLLTHGSRTLARGWDGQRLSHGAFAFALMTLFGVVSTQTKQIAAGRDPLSLDASTPEGRHALLQGVLQGGGLGPFGDIVTQDKTRYGNSWAAFIGGPVVAAAEGIGGQWAVKNAQLFFQGRDTNFLGDALWIASRFVPGSSLWYAKAAFQRAVTDQLLLMGDERAPERFARIEERARQDFNQQYWWRRGQLVPQRAPAIGGGR